MGTNSAVVAQIGYSGGQFRLQGTSFWNLGPEIEVADAEEFVILKALQRALRTRDIHEVYVFVDSQAALQRLQKSTFNHIGHQIRSLVPRFET